MRLLFPILLIALLAMPALAADEISVIEMYLRADQYEQMGELDQAYDLYQKIAPTGDSAVLALRLYDIERKRGNIENAQHILKNAYDKYQSNYDVVFSYGLFCTILGDSFDQDSAEYKKWYSEADKAFTTAVKLQPSEKSYLIAAMTATALTNYKKAEKIYYMLIDDMKMPQYYRALGLLKIKQNKQSAGIKYLKKAVDLANDIQACIHLSDIYIKEKDSESAVKYLLKVAELEPELTLPLLYLGEYYRDKKDYENAIRFYTMATDGLDGAKKVGVLKQIGGIAMEKSDFNIAFDAFNKALQIDKNDQQLFYFAGITAELTGQKDIALNVYTDGVKKYPDYATLRKRLAIIYIDKNNPTEAIRLITTIDEIERDTEYYLILANAYEKANDLKNTEKTLVIGLQENPSNVQMYAALAFLYDKSKRLDECISLLQQGIKYNPDSAVLNNFLGYLYADNNRNLEDAYKLINSALEKEPENYAYIDSLAWLHFRQGNLKDAHRYILIAHKLQPEDPEVTSHKKQIEDALGRSK